MMKKLLTMFVIIVLSLTLGNLDVYAANKVEKPTYKVSVSDNGTVNITVNHKNPKAKIYYKQDGIVDNKCKYISPGATLKFNYKDIAYMNILAKVGKNTSDTVKIYARKVVDDKYETMYKNIVDTVTSGKSGTDKLVSIWDWIMRNTQYAYTDKGGIDYTMCEPASLLFEGKGTCEAFAALWEDMATYAGFETKSPNVSSSHVANITKVDGKWFYVDTTHNYKMKEVYYDKFLNNECVGFKSNFKGYDLSSKRYQLIYPNGDTVHYWNDLALGESDIGYVTYDKAQDRYVFICTDEE